MIARGGTNVACFSFIHGTTNMNGNGGVTFQRRHDNLNSYKLYKMLAFDHYNSRSVALQLRSKMKELK